MTVRLNKLENSLHGKVNYFPFSQYGPKKVEHLKLGSDWSTQSFFGKGKEF